MKAFFVLCLATFAAADVSELSKGYDYRQPSGSKVGGLNGFDVVGGIGNHHLDRDFGAATALEPSVSGSVLGDEQRFREGNVPASVTKNFYSVTAQDDDNEGDDDFVTGGAQKNYDVIFAKAPTPSLNSVLKALQGHTNQQQTDVYVLTKKLDTSELADALRQSGIKTNKPHVHFIKYKTAEEAEHAQQRIKAQYDALGGSSQYQNEASVPVRSVVGSLRNHRRGSHGSGSMRGGFGVNGESHIGAGSSFSGIGVPSFSNRYLPPRY